jgi:hypothetical protein
VIIASAARQVENSLVRNEVGCASYGLYNLVLYLALVLSPLPGDCHLEGHGLDFLDVVGQPYCGEASLAEFVFDTIPMIEHLPHVKRTIQALLIPLPRFSVYPYLAFIIRIDEIAKVAIARVAGEGCGCH